VTHCRDLGKQNARFEEGLAVSETILLTGVGRAGQAGETIARELATRHYRLILVDRDAPEVEARAVELREAGFDAHALAADLSDHTSVDTLGSRLRDLCDGHLSAAVFAAGGFAMSGGVADLDFAAWDRMFMINLRTALISTRATLPLLRPKGSIVYFGSTAALPGGNGAKMSAYVAAKAGVLALMRSVAEEERATGVRANAVAPVAIRTADNVRSMGENARYVEREDLARVVAWLCADESRPTTGQVIVL
jgi:NAD(P)-dependent dehydrogenase (short-subunit alcohol dehydrogenase family)